MEKVIKNFCKSNTTHGHHSNSIKPVFCAQEEVVQEEKGIKCEQEGYMLIQKWTQTLKCACKTCPHLV